MPRTDNTSPGKVYIGIDNGVTGSIGICTDGGATIFKTPVHSCLSYTKKKQNITRIKTEELKDLLKVNTLNQRPLSFCLIERPMVNPGRFKATVSALRALEASLIVLEDLEIPYQYIDSKEWQKALLPSGLKGPAELKKASMEIACRLFPHLKDRIIKHKDGDGLLIAEYARRKGL